ncbi:MAG TPA: hypothetical protein VK508_03500 [Cyclobacteriaceae bacterium]|nr:hypothetical protein [Cyclobacteriaceae bacterium]
MRNSLLLCVLALIAIGCNPKYYSPNTQNVPLLSEKGEVNLSLSGNTNQAEFQGAYAAGEHFALQANGGLFIPKDLDNGDGGSGKFIEVGAGYFTPVSERFVFELYGLAGTGSVENDLRSRATTNPPTTGVISANVFRYGIQPNFGFKSKYFSAAVSSRIVNLNYSNIDGDLVFEGANQRAYLNDNKSNFLFEPALTLKAGVEKLRFQLQIGHSFNLSNENFRQDNAYATVGLNFRFVD